MKKYILTVCCLLGVLAGIQAQDKLYPNTFGLNRVKLLEGPFKQACDLNVKTLKQYDTDRLLAPYPQEAGLPS